MLTPLSLEINMVYQTSDVAGLFNAKHHFPEELFLVYMD